MEQIKHSSFFDYAIKDNGFIESLTSYSLKFPEDIRLLNFYLDNSFQDPYSRIFLLIRTREKLYSKHEDVLMKKDKHIKSIFYNLLRTHFSMPRFNYSVRSLEDIIVLIDIMLIVTIDKEIFRIIDRTDLSKPLIGYNQDSSRRSVLLENYNLLCISPFASNPYQLKKIIIQDILNLNRDFPEHEFYEGGSDSQIVLSTIDSIYDEILTRTNSHIIRNYYLNQLQRNFGQVDMDAEIITDFNSSYEQFISKEFDENFLKSLSISELSTILNIDVNEILGINSEEKELDTFVKSEKLKKSKFSKIKINSTFRLADNVFKKYFELTLSSVRYNLIYPHFRLILADLFNHEIISKELKIVELTELEVKKFIGFFSDFKSTNTAPNLFSYKVDDLIIFLEHITGLVATKSTWEKSHRIKNFSLDKNFQREINSIIDKCPDDKKW